MTWWGCTRSAWKSWKCGQIYSSETVCICVCERDSDNAYTQCMWVNVVVWHLKHGNMTKKYCELGGHLQSWWFNKIRKLLLFKWSKCLDPQTAHLFTTTLEITSELNKKLVALYTSTDLSLLCFCLSLPWVVGCFRGL